MVCWADWLKWKSNLFFPVSLKYTLCCVSLCCVVEVLCETATRICTLASAFIRVPLLLRWVPCSTVERFPPWETDLIGWSNWINSCNIIHDSRLKMREAVFQRTCIWFLVWFCLAHKFYLVISQVEILNNWKIQFELLPQTLPQLLLTNYYNYYKRITTNITNYYNYY